MAAQETRQRDMHRVPARLTLSYEVVAPEHAREVCEQVLSQLPMPREEEIEVERLWHAGEVTEKIDEYYRQMARLMRQIDSKLDYVIALAESDETPPPQPTRHACLLDLSGGGLAFQSKVALDLGAVLKMRLELSRFPLDEIVCVGRVVHCRPSGEPLLPARFEIGVQYMAIHEADRETIFRMISRIERRLLRERKEAQNP